MKRKKGSKKGINAPWLNCSVHTELVLASDSDLFSDHFLHDKFWRAAQHIVQDVLFSLYKQSVYATKQTGALKHTEN